jgi:hypothetical protein
MTPRAKNKTAAHTINDGSANYVDVHNAGKDAVTIHIGDGTYELAADDSRTFATGGWPVTASADVETGPHQDPLRIFSEPGEGDGNNDTYLAQTITVEQDIAARDQREQMTGDGVSNP